jgi:hypothetical protein
MAGEPVASAASGRLLLLTRECNNHCIFCGQEGLPPAAERDPFEDLTLARRDSDTVTFAGGEPTRDARLPDLVSRAKALGFARVILQTNGAALDDALAARLAREGLTAVHLSVHGADARAHDYHTGNTGSFDRVFSAARAARSAALLVSATTVVTRSNFRVLAPIPSLLASLGVFAWTLSFARIAGRAAEAVDRVVPRYGLAVPYALQAMETAGRCGLETAVSGVPACLLGPFAARSLPEAPRAFASMCAGCDARPVCAGVDAMYLARFDGDELRAVSRVPRDRGVDGVAPFFAGPGAMAEPSRPVAQEARSKRALPVLGKVRPALAEAPSGTARRSGEALREILPALFEQDEREPDPR